MKTKSILALALLISSFVWSQSGINYKAVISDGSGNIISNTLIVVQFSILDGATNVYQENHTPTTNSDGLIIINIGEGTPLSGTFAAIDWTSNNHFLNVQIDTGGGLVDLGTTQFLSVPYSLSAEIAKTAENVTGLEAIDEGNGLGWRFIGRDPINHANMAFNAIDLSTSSNGILGPGSFVIGNGNTASGGIAFAGGIINTASGDGSVVFGSANQATAIRSTAFGSNTEASGDNSTVFGTETKANAFSSFSIGRGNIGGGDTANWVETDPLFEIGNGDNINPSNALIVLKNGTITAPSFDINQITDDKALITKEYADANLLASGLEALDEGNGIGWRLKGRDPTFYDNLGSNAVDLSYSTGPSDVNGASGARSTAMGVGTIASGINTTAFGSSTEASGGNSTAMGFNTVASGVESTAMGRNTIASGVNSTAMGYETKAEAYYSTTIGRYNNGGGNPTLWSSTDPLFEIGNGTFNGTSNALTVFKSGEHLINSSARGLGIFAGPSNNGISIFSAGFNGIRMGSTGDTSIVILNAGADGIDVNGAIDNGVKVTSADRNGGYFRGTDSGVHAVASNDAVPDIILGGGGGGDEGIISSDPVYSGSDVWLKSNDAVVIRLDQNGTQSGDLEVRNGLDNIVFNLNESGNATMSGTLTQNSDIRLKKDIDNLSYGLSEVIQLQPKSYLWIDQQQDDLSIGLIAQEVHEVLPELVSVTNEENEILGISYIELIPVLVNAIKEQQDIINKYEYRIENLEQTVNAILTEVRNNNPDSQN